MRALPDVPRGDLLGVIERIAFAAGRQDAADAGFDDSLVVRRGQPLAGRPVRAAQAMPMREEAMAGFGAWRLKGDRVEYWRSG